MNTDTGKVYVGANAIKKAIERGEHLAPVSDRVAKFVSDGRAMRLRDLEEPCTCTHKQRHHFNGSRRPCKYRGCLCRAFVLPEVPA